MFTIDDITDLYLPVAGEDVATPVLDLTSIYALYDASFDATEYAAAGPPSTELVNGGALRAAHGDGSPVAGNTSFSRVGFGDTRGWGPDYDFERAPGLELPGSSGSPATLEFTLAGARRTLAFTNVVTQSRDELGGVGTLAIFVRLVTADGAFTRIDYQWMMRASATEWVPATAEQIAVAISGAGGYISFHFIPSWSHEDGFAVPPQPAGSLPWTLDATHADEICGMAVSFDGKFGLRHFIGGVAPRPGVTCRH